METEKMYSRGYREVQTTELPFLQVETYIKGHETRVHFNIASYKLQPE